MLKPHPLRRTRRRLATVVATLMLAGLALTGCVSSYGGAVSVVAGFYPLQFIAERLTGSSVTNLTSPGAEPHDLELSVSAVAEISKADLVLHENGMQPAVDKAVAENNDKAGLDVSGAARLRDTSSGTDPHFWQDPQRMRDVAAVIASRLEKIDPDHAADYRTRLAALDKELAALTTSLRTTFASCTSKTLVVSHEAFGYWKDYGMTVVPLGGLSPESETSAARIHEIEQLVRDKQVPTVYGEDIVSSKAAQTVSQDTGVGLEKLSTIESVKDGDYVSLMKSNIAAVARGNHCR